VNPNEDRLVAGLRCSEVLALLSDYLDRELGAADREGVEAHLRGCDRCARFGGELRATVRALREHLLAGSAPPGFPARLRGLLGGG
jgi:anti-sigma factor RsiW